jgi:hypothetical protein
MAMDAALSPSTVEQVLRFVSQKLSPQDFAQVRGLLTVAERPPSIRALAPGAWDSAAQARAKAVAGGRRLALDMVQAAQTSP